MEGGGDNIMSILRSITPIKYKFSKENKLLDKTFKTMSLRNLIKNLDYHPKIKDEFAPSPEFLNNKNKYELNFRNSNEYIKELSDLNNLPLVINNKNCLKNGTFNPDYDVNILSNKDEKKKVIEEKEKRKRERLEERIKRLKNWKGSDLNIDSLKYHPNYDFIKKKVLSFQIRPPIVKKLNKINEEMEKNNDIKVEQNNDVININHNNDELNKNKKHSIIYIDKNNNNTNNNSIIFSDSKTNRSNSSKIKYIDSNNNYLSTKSISRNIVKTKEKVNNLKNRLKYLERNSSANSDYGTVEINKSTNIEDLSLIHQEKFGSAQSMRNINSKKIYLPKIERKSSKKSIKIKPKRNNEIKHSIYFKKMLGRKDSLFGDQTLNLVQYFPNYDFFRLHIPSVAFKYHKNDDDYKKYITGKIIRGYNYSPEKYFVFEYKKNKARKINMNRERLKMIEILKKKIE